MASVDLQAVHDTLVSVAFEAGRMILSANTSSISTDTKMNAVDIVTETDQAVERMVTARLRAAFPSFAFVGEETYQPGVTRITEVPTFIVDPIDGTTNFDLLFTGVKGAGSYMQRNASLEEGPREGDKLRLPLAAPARRRWGPELGARVDRVGQPADGENFALKARRLRSWRRPRRTAGP
ncbi:hypothetical protein NEMBOFW57_006540 [Staphylotrichum longicolle]|uniref:Inositol-phosphate phosphatase n=1 Tax=Staphylotrichum longicolle TaxID=669026 RepID=A0AAD4HY56_9PEZI|nr:hypothetical protein NEMBOFW57_006540 [Staphylotrichum longicolle]